jgi:hypothetical protein
MQLPINHNPSGSADAAPDDISGQLESLCIEALTEIERLELIEWEKLLERKNEIQ